MKGQIERMERIDAVVIDVRTRGDIEYFTSLHDNYRQYIARHEVTVVGMHVDT